MLPYVNALYAEVIEEMAHSLYAAGISALGDRENWKGGVVQTRAAGAIPASRLAQWRGERNSARAWTAPTVDIQAASDEPSPLMARLSRDGVHDDSAALQAVINRANQMGIKTVTLPAGVYDLKNEVWFYGSGMTLQGQGEETILLVDHHYQGAVGGWGLRIAPKFGVGNFIVAAPVAKQTLVVRGHVDFRDGETVFLTNGRGSAREAERRLGGQLTGPGIFSELGTVDYVKIASSAPDENGNTVLHLASELRNAGDYFNVAPAGVAADEHYLHVKRIIAPAEQLMVKDLAVRFADESADVSIYSFYTRELTLANIAVLNTPDAGGLGGVGIVGSIGTHVQNLRAPASDLALSSSRYMNVSGCAVKTVTLEEGVTDSVIEKNTLTNRKSIGIRTGDMLCARVSFLNNTLNASTSKDGAIGIWEGTDITLEGNVIAGEGESLIWLGRTRGVKVKGNTAARFANYDPLGALESSGNSWEKK